MSDPNSSQPQPTLDRQYIVTLISDLRDFEESVQAAAMQRLQMLDRQALMYALIALVRGHEAAIDERCDAVLALVKLDPYTGVPLVVPFLTDPDSGIRCEVCDVLYFDADNATEQAIIPLTLFCHIGQVPSKNRLLMRNLGRWLVYPRSAKDRIEKGYQP